MSGDDRDEARLRAVHERLRAHDRRAAPPFEALRRPRRASRARAWAVAGTLASAAAIVLALCRPSAEEPARVTAAPPAAAPPAEAPPPPVVAANTAALPLDFLLASPLASHDDTLAFLARVPAVDPARGPR